MKSIILATISVFSLFATIVLSSCGNEPCAKMVCANSGVCKESKCACQVGYEGEFCEVTTRDKFIGLYQVNEDGTLSGNAQFNANIIPGDNINEVKIKNFQNYFTQPVVAVCKADTITINEQTIDNKKIKGWGYIQDPERLTDHYYKKAIMTLYFSVYDNVTGQTNNYGFPNGDPSLYTK